ncbi:hypothetical protein SCNRRL3882_7874 [Streptomyces chartreusis NRRL 3882]|uniref:Uncharacterized protein n=1 Tax=Streptomyces chartreusis NRRL 3882 TaxID=1079985 RepID=A0A2N9BM39_STRCX|nr:hypothetical protein SCNRRL3882_7874 [Streptomyces chartreusis NRRL 3882]
MTDWGSIEAARARHCFRVMDGLVYDQPHHRATPLFHSLCRLQALEHLETARVRDGCGTV